MREETKQRPKLIVLTGPTASGKTAWALKLAHAYNGEIISADSRQIYTKMTIGTAKPMGEWRRNGLRQTYFVEDIPHHLIDFLDPGKQFTVAQFRDKALKYIKMAHAAGRQPIVVGGTGLYIQALVDNLNIPRIAPNKKLRRSLEEKSGQDLQNLLRNIDPRSAERIDPRNKRRMIRALEVSILSGEPFSEQQVRGEQLFDTLKIAPQVAREELYRRIGSRVESMMEHGLLGEVQSLVRQQYGWNLPSMSGIGYRQFRAYIEGTGSLNDAVERLKRETRHFARRQMTWFRRDGDIHWCDTYEASEALVKDFLAQ